MKAPFSGGLPCGAAWGAVALFLFLVGRFWHPAYGFTALLQLDESNDAVKISSLRQPSVYVYHGTGGYDGLYYAQIACDPLLRSPELPRAIDSLSYRARRILPPAAAWLLAGGRPIVSLHLYSILNAVVWLVLAGLLWRLLAVDSFTRWLAWAGVLFSAGTLGSVRLALTDLPMLTLLAAALSAAERGRLGLGRAGLAAAALSRETALLGLAGLWARPADRRRNLVTGLLVVLPLAVWLSYVRWRVGQTEAGWGNFSLPLAGFFGKWTTSLAALTAPGDALLAWTTLLALLGLTVQAVFILTRWRLYPDRWWRVGAAYAGLLCVLGPAVWEGHPGAASRVLLPLTLAFNLLVTRTRAPLVWLLLGNLGVGAGLLSLRDLPYADELYAARQAGVALVVQVGPGWHPPERTLRHTWAWSSGPARLLVKVQADTAITAQFTARVRRLAPGTVTIRQDGRVLWSGAVGLRFSPVAFTVRLQPGANGLDFTTDTPALRESDAVGARVLAVAVQDPRLEIVGPEH